MPLTYLEYDYENNNWIYDEKLTFYYSDYTEISKIQDNSFAIYPNPASTQITISKAENSQLEIYNSLGQLILSENIELNNQTIDISAFEKGIYHIKLQLNEKIVSKKLIIN